MPGIPVSVSILVLVSGLFLVPGLSGCRKAVSGLTADEEAELRAYRDSLLDLDMGYPQGWTFTEKKSYSPAGRTHDLLFEPAGALWTRRFSVKVYIPDRSPVARGLEDFKKEYLERLGDRASVLRLDDTAWTTLGGETAFHARYTTFMDGKAFTRNADYLSRRGGRDISLAFEVSDGHAGEDSELYRRIAERFRYYRP